MNNEKILKERKKFEYDGKTIYEWEQGLQDVIILIKPPSQIKFKMIDYKLTTKKLTLGIKGSKDLYLNNEFLFEIKPQESYITFEDGVLTFTLQKMIENETWKAVFKDHITGQDLVDFDSQKAQLLREKFQDQYGGFDFSEVKFEGRVPDPRTFMEDLDRIDDDKKRLRNPNPTN